jgi:hypothetical protein
MLIHFILLLRVLIYGEGSVAVHDISTIDRAVFGTSSSALNESVATDYILVVTRP